MLAIEKLLRWAPAWLWHLGRQTHRNLNTPEDTLTVRIYSFTSLRTVHTRDNNKYSMSSPDTLLQAVKSL